ADGAPFVIGASLEAPPHDFDYVAQGPSPGPELWAAFLPVGYTDNRRNNYDEWARQLAPFFKKVMAYYRQPSVFGRSFYLVSNDLTDVSQLDGVWKAIGPRNIDFYSIDERKRSGVRGERYVRAPLEKYRSIEAFLTYARTLPWMGEGWQKSSTFLQHMNGTPHRVVWWNVHSTETFSLISSEQARTEIKPGKGGVIALVTGCSVGAYRQPGSSAFLNTATSVEDNFLVSLVYGPSAFVAATGCPHNRVSDDLYAPLLEEVYHGGYLGLGHRKQLLEQDRHAPRPEELRAAQEILIGDPFADASGGDS
ncbi:MAG: hypothetical protein AB1758_15595, partial [Candidatus Eremiobacterota bacterium]